MASPSDGAAGMEATAGPFPPPAFVGRILTNPVVTGARTPVLYAAFLVAIGYYLGAKIGFALTLQPIPISILWPPNAILLAGLLVTPVRSWAFVLAAAFVAHLAAQMQGGVPIGMVLCWFVSNSIESLIGAVAFRRLSKDRPRLDTFRETAILLACAGFLAPFLSSFLDAAFVAMNGWGDAGYWANWRTRFFSNVLAEITLVPLIVTTVWGVAGARRVPRSKWLEATILLALVMAVSWFVFVYARSGPAAVPALVYAPFPLLVAAAVRLGPWGASASFAVCALVASWGAAHGQGPFVTRSPAENALTIQIFLIISWVPVMSFATLTLERARAVSAAQRSEEQLGIALDAAQLGRWDWDIATQRLEWSDITRQMYGVPLDTPVGPETFMSRVHPDDRVLMVAATEDAVAGRPIDVEFRIVLPDGTVRWLMSRGKTIFGADGRPLRMAGIKVDITARKQTEMELKEQQRELAHIDRLSMVGELSVAIAHELNQPLAAIRANAGAARRYLAHDPPNIAQVREIIDAIAQDNQRAAGVIQRVGALLRRGEGPSRSLQMNEVVEDVIDIARADVIARGVSLSTRLEPGLQAIAGDRVQLQQVLLNLVLNACDAMESAPGPARLLEIATLADAQNRVRVTVCDTGPGVAGDQLERIFEPFVTSKHQGLGLGLAVCRSIISAHDGRLWAENNRETGASFCFDLPALTELVKSAPDA